MTDQRTEYLTALIDARDTLEESATRIYDVLCRLHLAGTACSERAPDDSPDEEELSNSRDGNVQMMLPFITSLLSVLAALDANEGPGQLGLSYRPFTASQAYWDVQRYIDANTPELGL